MHSVLLITVMICLSRAYFILPKSRIPPYQVSRQEQLLATFPEKGESETASDEIELIESKILFCRRSFNPVDWFKISYLEDKRRFLKERVQENRAQEKENKAQEKENRAQQQKENRAREKENKAQELKTVRILYATNDEYITVVVNRKLFEKWKADEKFLYDEFGEGIASFESIVPNCTYFIKKISLAENFEAYANYEADLQIRDLVVCIQNGEVLIPPFNENSTAILDYNIPFDKDVQVPGNKFLSPIRPDAILIHGSKWLIIEAKHAFTIPLLNVFKAKGDFIRSNADKTWVRRKYPVPTDIQLLACSVSNFPRARGSSNTTSSDFIKVVRDGLGYNLVV